MTKTTILLTGAALAVATTLHGQSVIADWTFETSVPASAGPFSPETGSGSAIGSHAGAATYSSPAGNGSSHSFSANTWAVGDYYQVQVSTTGLSSIGLSFDQTSSTTGPGHFGLYYSTDGTHFTSLASYTVLANSAPNPVWNATTGSSVYTMTYNLSTLTAGASDNQPVLDLRFQDLDTVSAAGGTVAASGTDRMDNIMVYTPAAVPEPSTLALFGLGGSMCLGFFRRFKK